MEWRNVNDVDHLLYHFSSLIRTLGVMMSEMINDIVNSLSQIAGGDLKIKGK